MDELSYNDVVKKQNKGNQIFEEKKEIECQDWKKSLETAYAEK